MKQESSQGDTFVYIILELYNILKVANVSMLFHSDLKHKHILKIILYQNIVCNTFLTAIEATIPPIKIQYR